MTFSNVNTMVAIYQDDISSGEEDEEPRIRRLDDGQGTESVPSPVLTTPTGSITFFLKYYKSLKRLSRKNMFKYIILLTYLVFYYCELYPKY